ncbi:hypothetical protein [Pseudomonas sp.]|uniref:hypothetical protein n=1 Tax=Pseudomonas sp. TaxID=306 RepID=UPI0029060BCC|nr:hypothetical protein [Pseudomonas sp.]MDU4249015.1 hypothetical protein [Pseudomonas sp.]
MQSKLIGGEYDGSFIDDNGEVFICLKPGMDSLVVVDVPVITEGIAHTLPPEAKGLEIYAKRYFHKGNRITSVFAHYAMPDMEVARVLGFD